MTELNTKNNEAIYASAARAMALYNNLLSKEKLERLVLTSDFSEEARILSEAGYNARKDSSDVEKSLSEMLKDTYSLLDELFKDFPKASEVLKLKYDCHNIKSAIKCRFANRDVNSLMIDVGVIPASDVIEAIANKDVRNLPENMGKAALEAIEAYAAAPDPQLIDTKLDIACFADMTKAAEECGFDFPKAYTALQIDLANILIKIRSSKLIKNPKKAAGFIIPGGKITFTGLECDKFIEKLKYTEYGKLADAICECGTSDISAVERLCRDCEADVIKKTAYMNDACADVYGYIIRRENEIKNVRIIMSCKKSKLDKDTVFSRLRIGLV